MKRIIILILLLNFPVISYADRVVIQKSTGKLIEYQSGGNNPKDLDIIRQNALNYGYSSNDIEAKFITPDEWKELEKEKLIKPAEEKAKKDEEEKNKKIEKVKQKLNLSEKDFQDLKEALKR